MGSALPWIEKRPLRAGEILARVGGQAMMDAFLDNQGVEVPEEVAQTEFWVLGFEF